jgi:hypothetical protein
MAGRYPRRLIFTLRVGRLFEKGLKRKLSFVQIEGFWRFLDVSPDAIQSKNQKVINNSNVYSGNPYNRLVINH